MKIAGFEIKKIDKKKDSDDNWKSLKKTVDKIFDITSEDRKAMQDNLDFYNGKIWKESSLRPDDTRAIINLVFSTIQSIVPTLSDNRPIWSVIARYPFMQRLANSYDAALKYGWDKLDMSMVVHLVALDAFIMKVGLFYVDYDYSDGEGGEICIEAQDPREFFIAPGYTDIWKAPFCGIKGKRPLSIIRRMFGKDVEVKPDSNDEEKSMLDRKIGYGTAEDYELETYFATLYVVWMRDDITEVEIETDTEGDDGKKKKEKVKAYPYGKFVYFTNNEYLGTRASEKTHGKPPWVSYLNYVKPHDFLGTSEVDNIKELVKEYNLLFQKVCAHIRKYHDKNYTVDISKISDVAIVKKTFHEGGNLYPYDGQQDHNPPIEAIDPGQLITDIYNVLAMIPKIIEESSGATDVSKGIASKKQRQSASEIAVLVESSYTRTRQRVRNLEWSEKRVCWLLLKEMQQNYSEMRTFHVKKDNEVITDNISNSNAFAQSMVASPEIVKKGMEQEGLPPGQEPSSRMSEDEQQEYEDYKKFCEIYGNEDPVYFDFDIVIETDSSLPLDKQSLANLAMNLFAQKAIDRQALLEKIAFPRWQEISDRMDQKEQAEYAAAHPQQGQLPPGESLPPGTLGGQSPLDIQDQMTKMSQGAQNE